MRTSLCTAARRCAATADELADGARAGVEADAWPTIIFGRGPESTWNTASGEAC
jgi:hypothetical protein